MKPIVMVAWILVTLVVGIDPLCASYTVTSDLQTALSLGIHVDPAIFKPPKTKEVLKQ